MRSDRLISLGLIAPFRRILSGKTDRQLPVLMYHGITDDPEAGVTDYYKTCTSPRRFAEHMQWLADDGWRGVTLSEGLSALRLSKNIETGGSGRPSENSEPKTDPRAACPYPSAPAPRPSPPATPASGKLVAITFDDGFRDFHTAAFPALQRHGFCATMYLPTAFIGEERRTFKSRECLTWGEVREVAAAGIEFGSHTVNHPKLVDLNWPEIERELRDSKAAIEHHLGSPVTSFAYPFAFPQANRPFTQHFREVLVAAGYQSSATTIIGRVHAGDDRLQLARLPANSADDRALLMAKLAGAYDWLAVPQALSKAIHRYKSKLTPA